MVLLEIESKTDFNFFYNNSLIDVSKKTSLKVNNQDVKSVLQQLLADTQIDYRLVKNQIILFPKGKDISNQIKVLLQEDFNKEKDKVLKKEVKSITNQKDLSTIKLLQQVVKGNVKDVSGISLPGVSILIEGTTRGTETDFDGNYAIQANNGDVLVFSFLGYTSQKITVANDLKIDVTLKESANILDEVIVTGYSQTQKIRVTGAAQNIKTESLVATSRASIQESFQGNVSGVHVISSSGQPGSIPTVRIRGVGSFSSSAPLYVLDGIPVSSGTMTSLNSEDIKSVSVLKDASATSIYGTRGANGVIVITTKSGRKGATKINYSTQVGISTPSSASKFRPLNTAELQELMIEGLINKGQFTNNADALNYLVNTVGFNPDVNTNWYDLLTRDGMYNEHNVSASGGGDKSRFYFSGSYYKQDGVILASSLERVTSRLRINNQINDKLKFESSFSFSSENQHVRPDAGAFANPVRAIYRLRPDLNPFNDDGSYNLTFNSTHNPIAQAENEIRNNKTYRLIGSFTTSYQFSENFSYDFNLNTRYRFTDIYRRKPAVYGDARASNGDGSQGGNYDLTYNIKNILRYTKDFDDKNHFSAFVGYEFLKSNSKSYYLETEQILDRFEDLAAGTTPVDATTSKSISGLSSVFLNGEYSYNDKYLFSGSVRRDGSSKFAPKNRFATFWSVGLGWNIAKESFMSDIAFVNDLKLRASYGTNGNDGIGNNQFLTFFSSNSYDGQTGFALGNIGNPDIVWEKNKPLDIGVDFNLFSNRISGSFDWYTRESTNLLRSKQISAFNGDGYSITSNIGSMKNSGIELTLNTQNIVSKNNGFSWDSNITFTTNKNQVTRLENNNAPITGTTSIIKVGEDIYTFYLPLYAGVDPLNGNALWYTDGTKSKVTSVYEEAKQAIAGSSTPDFYGGFKNTFRYKGFSLGMQFYTSWGGKVYDTWARYTNSDGSRATSTSGNVNRGTYERRWQKPGDITDVPAYVFNNSQTGKSSQSSSRFVYDGSYIRLREVELSYKFDRQTLETLGFSSFKIFAKGNNLWTYTKDKRLERDPEAGLSGRLNQEIPISKTIFFGLNLTF